MRYFSKLIFYVAIFLFALTTLPLIANQALSSSKVTAWVKDRINESFDVEVSYQKPTFSFLAFGLYAKFSEFSVMWEDTNVLKSPKAEVWWDTVDGWTLLFHEPEVLLPREILGVISAEKKEEVGDFTLMVKQAHLASTATSVAIQAVDFQIRHQNEHWQVNMRSDDEAYTFDLLARGDDVFNGEAWIQFSDWNFAEVDLGRAKSLSGEVWISRDHTISFQTILEANHLMVGTISAQSASVLAEGEWSVSQTIATVSIGILEIAADESELTLDMNVIGVIDNLDDHWAFHRSHWMIDSNAAWSSTLNLNATVLAWKSQWPIDIDFSSQLVGISPLFPETSLTIQIEGNWQQQQERWNSSISYLSMKDKNMALTSTLYVSGHGGSVAIIEARGKVGAIKANQLYLYIPANEAQEWFAESLLNGEISETDFYLNFNPMRPFTEADLRLTAVFSNSDLLIALEGWPLAKSLSGVFVLDRNAIHIEGDGAFGDLFTKAVVARIPDIYADKSTLLLSIRGQHQDILSHYQTALSVAVIEDEVEKAFSEITLLNGKGQINLDIRIPLSNPKQGKVSITLYVEQIEAQHEKGAQMFEGQGEVFIDNENVQGVISGKSEKGSGHELMTIAFNPRQQVISGEIKTDVLLSILSIESPFIDGNINFNLMLSPTLTIFTAPLTGMVIDLPYPLGKAGKTEATISVALTRDEINFLFANAHLSVDLLSTTVGVDIAINDDLKSPTAEGIYIHGGLEKVNIDLWLDYLKTQTESESISMSVELTLSHSSLFNIESEKFVVRHTVLDDLLAIDFEEGNLLGQVTLAKNYLSGHFEKMVWTSKSRSQSEINTSISSLTVSLQIESFLVGSLTLGSLQMQGEPKGERWLLSTFSLQNEDVILNLSGESEQGNTFLTLFLTVAQVSHLLNILQTNPIIEEGNLIISGGIAWPGEISHFDLSKIKGSLRLTGNDIRYTDAGLGSNFVNFLSIFSPQSLLKLGFTEVVKKGIIFDTVEGEIDLEEGNAFFNPMIMQSEDLWASMSGKTNFVFNQHNLQGRVRPGEKLLRAGSVLTLAGTAAFEPISFVAGTLLGKLLEEPISEIGAYDYTITGSWQDPIYKRLPASQVKNNSTTN